MVPRTLIAGLIAGGAFLHPGHCDVLATEPPALSEAFARLDALAKEIDERLRALGVETDTPQAPGPDRHSTAGCIAPDADPQSAGAQSARLSCAPRENLAQRTRALKADFEAQRRTVGAINRDLPAFRDAMLDKRVCTDALAQEIGAALGRLDQLHLTAGCGAVARIGPCIDRLRADFERRMKETDNAVLLQRLATELKHLSSLNVEVVAFEEALLRGISKRNRLVQELREFTDVIEVSCR